MNMNILKENKFQTKVYRCSGCDYRSLVKTPVQNHITFKCKTSYVIVEDKIVSHYDEHDTEKFCATLHQCSKCLYTTDDKQKATRHINSKKCIGSVISSSKRILMFEDVTNCSGKVHFTSNVHAEHSSFVAGRDNNVQITINNIIPTGTLEEKIAFVKALIPSVDNGNLHMSFDGDMSSLPSLISSITQNVDTRLNNKFINKNDVVSRTDSIKTPIGKHSKKEIFRLMNALYDAMKSKIDTKQFLDSEYDIDDVVELRRKLLPFFYKEPLLDKIDQSLQNTYDPEDTINDAEYQCVFPNTDFYEGCRCLVEDPKQFRNLPEDIQKQVRLAAKKYLVSLPTETREVGRPKNTL